MSKPADQFALNKAMRARAEQLTNLFKEQGIPLVCVYTSWEDAERAFYSCWGPNIADIGLIYRTKAGKQVSETEVLETYGFKCRSNNFNEMLVEIDARRFQMIVCDPNGQNPRSMLLAEVLKNAGKLFKHCGLPEDCNLYDETVDNGKVKLRMDLIFVPKGKVEEGDKFATTEFALTKYSYQAQTGNARNIDFFSWPQGTTCSDDVSGQKFLRPQCLDEETGVFNEFWIGAENTGKSVQDMQTETAEESAAAAARGKGTAVRSGCFGWEKLPNMFYFIQVPRKQDAPKWRRKSGAFAWTPTAAKDGADDDLGVDEADYSGGPCYRSLSGTTQASELESARLSRGSYAGKSQGVQSKTVERAKGETITVTCTMVVVVDGDGPPPGSDVKFLWYSKLMPMMDIAGNRKNLHDPEANLTNGPLTKEVMKAIDGKQQVYSAPPQVPHMPMAPTVGVPAEIS